MKKKLLVDFSYLSHRMIFVAQSQLQKTPVHQLDIVRDINEYVNILKKEDIERSAAIIDMYYHLVLKNLIHLKGKLGIKSEDIYLCLDGTSWRKEFYKEYKANRKKSRNESPIEWSEFYKMIQKVLDILNETTKINISKTQDAEGDDIMFVLSEKFSSEGDQPIIVTSDKDIRQVLRFKNTKFYDPMKDTFINQFSEEELLRHVLIGDASDNIPNIKVGSEFDKEFIIYLKQNNIFLEKVDDVQELEIFEELLEKYEGEKVYKGVRFGEKTAQKEIDNETVEQLLESNPIFKKNFERNKALIDMRNIPEYVKEDILSDFEKLPSKKNNMFELQDWLVKHKLKEITKDISKLLV